MKDVAKEAQRLVAVTRAAIEKAEKRGDLKMLARLIREQRHTLKWIERSKRS